MVKILYKTNAAKFIHFYTLLISFHIIKITKYFNGEKEKFIFFLDTANNLIRDFFVSIIFIKTLYV